MFITTPLGQEIQSSSIHLLEVIKIEVDFGGGELTDRWIIQSESISGSRNTISKRYSTETEADLDLQYFIRKF